MSRNRMLQIRVNEKEAEALFAAARQDDKSLSSWARKALLAALRTPNNVNDDAETVELIRKSITDVKRHVDQLEALVQRISAP